jgi:hypothetical protein
VGAWEGELIRVVCYFLFSLIRRRTHYRSANLHRGQVRRNFSVSVGLITASFHGQRTS